MRHILITLLIITGVVICSWEAGVVPGEALRSRDQQPCSRASLLVSLTQIFQCILERLSVGSSQLPLGVVRPRYGLLSLSGWGFGAYQRLNKP